MKHLKSYNESLRDKMVSKSDDEIWNNIKNLNPNELLYQSINNSYLRGVKYVVKNHLDNKNIEYIVNGIYSVKNNDILSYLLSIEKIRERINDINIYILEKYKLGLHQNEEKDFEKYIKNLFKNLTVLESKTKPNLIIYKKDNFVFANYFKDRIAFLINSNYLWNTLLVKKYKLDFPQFRTILKPLVTKYLSINENFYITFIFADDNLYSE